MVSPAAKVAFPPLKDQTVDENSADKHTEDGVDNSAVDNASLYTQPEDIWAIESAFRPISPYFSIAAGFGNVHGVCKYTTAFLEAVISPLM